MTISDICQQRKRYVLELLEGSLFDPRYDLRVDLITFSRIGDCLRNEMVLFSVMKNSVNMQDVIY